MAQENRQARISFAANLQPLEVSTAPEGDTGIFRTCALIAATPHTPINRKLVTDRCRSHGISCPKRSSAAAAATPAVAQHPQACSSQPRCPTAPQLCRACSPLFAHESLAPAAPAAAARRGSSAQSAQMAVSLLGARRSPIAALPPVLQFEGWWLRLGQGGRGHTCSVHISYHTDTEPAAFFVRGELDKRSGTEPYCRCDACATSGWRPQKNRSRICTVTTGSSSSSSSQPPVLPPEGAWLCVTGASAQPLDHFDLHVGAELSFMGRKVVLKKASCATMAWLDAWAKLLLQQQYSLEQQLAKFTPVIASQGLVRGTPQRSDYGSPGVPVTPTGGRVNLRHLREHVALLAARLRQHKADVRLPRELQDLEPQGPTNWVDELPLVMCAEPFTPAPAKHSSGTQLLQRNFLRHSLHVTELPSLGATPMGNTAANHKSLAAWLKSIPLANSAARSEESHASHAAGWLELP